jgi:ABC-2 type transport system permease protein
VSPARRLPRLLLRGTWTHVVYLSRSPIQIVNALLLPLVYATLAVYFLGGTHHPDRLLQSAVGAGLMGMWTSVLFGAGGAIQNQRGIGVLETLVAAPTPLVLVLTPITLATALIGTYSMLATVAWCAQVFGMPLHFAHPLLFVVAVPVCVLSLGLTGLLLASTFVQLRNANALSNVLDYPIWLLSGMLAPITALPGWTRPLSWALPPTWGARAVDLAALGGPPDAVYRAMGLALALGAACLGLAAFALVRVERRARATATLALT